MRLKVRRNWLQRVDASRIRQRLFKHANVNMSTVIGFILFPTENEADDGSPTNVLSQPLEPENPSPVFRTLNPPKLGFNNHYGIKMRLTWMD